MIFDHKNYNKSYFLYVSVHRGVRKDFKCIYITVTMGNCEFLPIVNECSICVQNESWFVYNLYHFGTNIQQTNISKCFIYFAPNGK